MFNETATVVSHLAAASALETRQALTLYRQLPQRERAHRQRLRLHWFGTHRQPRPVWV